MCSFVNYFSENIYYHRMKNNLTQQEMAKILGISVRTLSRLERGNQTVRIHSRMVLDFCDRLGISADELLLKCMERK